MNPAFVELMVRLERAIVENATAFVVVTVDLETGKPVNASGPFEEAEQALAQAGRDLASWREHAEPGEGDFEFIVVPLWEPGK